MKNAIWSLRPCTLLVSASPWQGERVPPHKRRCSSFPSQRTRTTPKVRPAPLQRRLLQLGFVLLRPSAGAEPERSPRVSSGSSVGASAREAAASPGSREDSWGFGQFLARPNRGVSQPPRYRREGLWRGGWIYCCPGRTGGPRDPSSAQVSGVLKAGVLAGPLCPPYLGSGLGQGSGPIAGEMSPWGTLPKQLFPWEGGPL